MSFIPCVTLANLTTPVTTISSGGGGGTYPANGVFSTIVINPTSGVGLTLGDNASGYSSMYFQNNSNTIDYSLQTQPTANPAIKTFNIAANAETSDSGIQGGSITSLRFPNANLNISTINGVLPGGGGSGAVESVSGTAFKSIIASPNTGAVGLSLGAIVGNFPTPPPPNPINFSNGTALVTLVEFNSTFTLANLAPGWYSICIPLFTICVAQYPVGTPNSTFCYPGSTVQYSLKCGTTGGTTKTTALYLYNIIPASNFAVYPQTSPMTMVGTFYQPVALGACNTLTLQAYFNSPDGSGISAAGYCSHVSPAIDPTTRVTITPLLSA